MNTGTTASKSAEAGGTDGAKTSTTAGAAGGVEASQIGSDSQTTGAAGEDAGSREAGMVGTPNGMGGNGGGSSLPPTTGTGGMVDGRPEDAYGGGGEFSSSTGGSKGRGGNSAEERRSDDASTTDAHSSSDGAPGDVNIPSANCDPRRPFGTPQLLPGGIETQGDENFVRISGAGLVMHYETGSTTQWATRKNLSDLFAMAEPPAEMANVIAFMNTSQDICIPSFTSNDLTVYLSFGGQARDHIFSATRASTRDAFPTPTQVTDIDVGGFLVSETVPYPSGDGNTLYFEAGGDLWSAERSSSLVDGGFNAPVVLDTVSSPNADDWQPVASADDLTLYFASDRASDGGAGADWNMWVARRSHRNEVFGPPEPVTELNTTGDEFPGWVSKDGCEIYYTGFSRLSNSRDILFARRGR